jgi:hypothetical protein
MRRELAMLGLIALASGVMIIALMPGWKREALVIRLRSALSVQPRPVNHVHERIIREFRQQMTQWERDRNAS